MEWLDDGYRTISIMCTLSFPTKRNVSGGVGAGGGGDWNFLIVSDIYCYALLNMPQLFLPLRLLCCLCVCFKMLHSANAVICWVHSISNHYVGVNGMPFS